MPNFHDLSPKSILEKIIIDIIANKNTLTLTEVRVFYDMCKL